MDNLLLQLLVVVFWGVLVSLQLPGADAELNMNKDFKVISEWAQAHPYTGNPYIGGMRNYNQDKIPWISTKDGDYAQTSVFAFRDSGAETRWIVEQDLGLSADWDLEYEDLGEIMRAFHQWGASQAGYISAFPTFQAQFNSLTGFRELQAVAIFDGVGSYIDESFPAFNSATAYERFREVGLSAPLGTIAFPAFINTLSFQTVVVVDSAHVQEYDLPIALLNHLKLAHWMTTAYVAKDTPTQPMTDDDRHAIIRQQTKAVRSLDICSQLITPDTGTEYRDDLLKTYDQLPIIYSNLIVETSPSSGKVVCAPPGTKSTGGRYVPEKHYKLEFIKRDKISIGDLLRPPSRQARSKEVHYKTLHYVLICPVLYNSKEELGRTLIHETMHAAGGSHIGLKKEGRRNCTNIEKNSPYFQTSPLRAECCMADNIMTLTSAFDETDGSVGGGGPDFTVSTPDAVDSIGLPATQQASDLPEACGSCSLFPSEWEKRTLVETVNGISVETQIHWMLNSDGTSSTYSVQVTSKTFIPESGFLESAVSAQCQITLLFQELAESQDCVASSLPYVVSGCVGDASFVDPGVLPSGFVSFLVDGSEGVLSRFAVVDGCRCLELQDDMGASSTLCRSLDSPTQAPSTWTNAPVTTEPSPSNDHPTNSYDTMFDGAKPVDPIGNTKKMTLHGSTEDALALMADSPALSACGPPILQEGSKMAVYKIDESTITTTTTAHRADLIVCLSIDTFGSSMDTVLGIMTSGSNDDSKGRNLQCLVEDDDTGDSFQSQIAIALRFDADDNKMNYWLFVAGYAYLSGNYTLNFFIQDCPEESPSMSPAPQQEPAITSLPSTPSPTIVSEEANSTSNGTLLGRQLHSFLATFLLAGVMAMY